MNYFGVSLTNQMKIGTADGSVGHEQKYTISHTSGSRAQYFHLLDGRPVNAPRILSQQSCWTRQPYVALTQKSGNLCLFAKVNKVRF